MAFTLTHKTVFGSNDDGVSFSTASVSWTPGAKAVVAVFSPGSPTPAMAGYAQVASQQNPDTSRRVTVFESNSTPVNGPVTVTFSAPAESCNIWVGEVPDSYGSPLVRQVEVAQWRGNTSPSLAFDNAPLPTSVGMQAMVSNSHNDFTFAEPFVGQPAGTTGTPLMRSEVGIAPAPVPASTVTTADGGTSIPHAAILLELQAATNAPVAHIRPIDQQRGTDGVFAWDTSGSTGNAISRLLTILDPGTTGATNASIVGATTVNPSLDASGLQPGTGTVQLEVTDAASQTARATAGFTVVNSIATLVAYLWDAANQQWVQQGSVALWDGISWDGGIPPAAVAPQIIGQSGDTTVTAGQPTTLSVTASGSNPKTYQWRLNGADITGANSATYTIPTNLATGSYTYTCVVANSVDSAISDPVVVTVVEAPVQGDWLVRETFDAMPDGAPTGDSSLFVRRMAFTTPEGTVATRTASEVLDGAASMKVTKDAAVMANFDPWTTKSGSIPVAAGKTYTLRCDMRLPDGAESVFLFIEWFTAAGTAGASSSEWAAVAATGATPLYVTGVAPSGAVFARLNARVANIGAGHRVLTDRVSFREGSDTSFPTGESPEQPPVEPPPSGEPVVPLQISDGVYVASGDTRTDTFAEPLTPGSWQVAICMTNTGAEGYGTITSDTGWTVPTVNGTEAARIGNSAKIVGWIKRTETGDPQTVTYTAPLGGVGGIRLYELPGHAQLAAVLAASGASGGVADLGSYEATVNGCFSLTGLSTVPSTTDKAVTSGFDVHRQESRLAWADRQHDAGVVDPDWIWTTSATFGAIALTFTPSADGGADEPAPDAVARDGFFLPFETLTYPTMAIGASALFTVDTATNTIRSISHYVNQNNGWSYVVRRGIVNAPGHYYADIVDTGDGSGTRKGWVPGDMPIPEGTGPGGYDRPCLVLQDDGTWITMYGANKISDTRWECFRVEDVSNYGDGISPGNTIGSRADGLADAWGLIRKWDFEQGKIGHVLAFAPPPSAMLDGHVWPAVTDDFGSYPAGGTIRMGMRFAIPSSETKPSGLTAGGSDLWDALVTHGLQIRDEGGGSGVFYAEQDPDPAFGAWVNGMITDLSGSAIKSKLQRVTNITSANYATWQAASHGVGGGAPLAPHPAPLA